MPITAGELNRRVELYSGATARGDGGSITESVTAEATVWAKVEPGVGGEAVRGDGQLNRQPTRFTIRKYTGIGPGWQVAYKGRFYEIEDVAEPVDGINEYLVLTGYADEAAE